jgi:hypothetical protein
MPKPEASDCNMPSTYKFLTFSDMHGMRNASAKTAIRRHAMKDIGASRRKWRGRKIPLDLSPDAVHSCEPTASPPEDHLPFAVEAAIYDPHVRSLGCKMDPFGTACISIDSAAHGLIRYFVYYSSNFPNNFTFTPRIDALMQSALQDNLLIHCILSAAASRVHYVENLELFEEREVISTQQSVRLLQNELRNAWCLPQESKERLVNCALYLGAGAIYRKDHFTAKIHVKAAMKLAELMGGVTNLEDPQVLLRIISLDDLLSCAELRPCTVAPCYDPGSSLSPIERRKDGNKYLGRFPSGFMIADRKVISSHLEALILRVLECHRMKCLLEADASNYSQESLEDRQRLRLRILATRNRLLALPTNDDTTETLRITLILCTLLPPGDLRQIRTAHSISRRLKALLAGQSERTWRGMEKLMLWCLLIGHYSSQPKDATQTWFAVKICQVVHREGDLVGVKAGPRLLADLIAFQEAFLFDSLVLRPLTDDLAQHTLERLLYLV